jgi:drug/metabolite transporter (DMT)-like permease
MPDEQDAMPGPLLYAVTVLIWGTTWYGIALQVGTVPETVSVAYRFAIAGALLLAFCLARGRRLAFGWRDQLLIAAQGACLFCINYVVFYVAAGYLPSGLLAVVFSTIVVMNMIGAALFFGTPMRRQVVVGAGIGLTGMGLLFWPELHGFDLSSDGMIGLGLSLFATAFVSAGNLISARNQRAGLGVMETNALGMSYGAGFTTVFALLNGDAFLFDTSFAYIGSLLYLAVPGSVIAFWCYLTLLGRIGAERASYAMVLFPVIALGVSTLVEGFRWSPMTFAGVALILAGNVLVMTRTGARAEAPARG